MRGSQRRIPRNLTRRRSLVGSVYNDYNDVYYDYTDYGNYPDTYPDYQDYNDYSDYGDYQDSGGRRDVFDPRHWKLAQKILILEGEHTYLLAGDPDIDSSLFEKLSKDDKGRKVGVLPALLNQGWHIRRILAPDSMGRIVILVQSLVPT